MASHNLDYDLLILVDTTFSMSDYLESLAVSLPKIITISNLTDCFSRIGLISYKDYCDRELIEWSGWVDGSEDGTTSAQLLDMAKNLEPVGGGDFPEATKTALAKAYEVMREDATTLILLYTDAAPHVEANADKRDGGCNWRPEQRALLEAGSYGGYGPSFADWVTAANTLHTGPKKAQVFCYLDGDWERGLYGYYNYLTKATHGCCMYLEKKDPAVIAQVTVETLLSWMGVEKAGSAHLSLVARMTRYVDVTGFKGIKKETDETNNKFFIAKPTRNPATSEIWRNMTSTGLTSTVLKSHLPKRKGSMQDFAKRYAVDVAYKSLVTRILKDLISTDVASISLNAVFGTLWRAVCNDRLNSERDALITAFGYEVDRITNTAEKERMKRWLEESYDYTAEVLDTIATVPAGKRYPCVLLDPTLSFTMEVENDDEAARSITDFSREELLEIGRSCDYRILRRLGKVLTRLTFVQSESDMPEHIAKMDNKDVTRIPMALAEPELGGRFWKILLHLIVPGTMLAARPAALLAALTLKLGVQPLWRSAVLEMIPWRTRWNNLEIPETWNVSCLSLLLDADEAYRTSNDATRAPRAPADLLSAEDRALFSRLVSYKMLELNMQTDLTAKVAWSPDKTRLPIGPLVVCSSCSYPRSVTMMADHGRCGLCAAKDWLSDDEKKTAINCNVSKDSNEQSSACWVECFSRNCRSQYVVYQVDKLNVRPKCYYCRMKSDDSRTGTGVVTAPYLECRQCQNRVIWPTHYRNIDAEDFQCVACTAGRKTIVEETTSAKLLSQENGETWLLRNDGKIKEPLNGRSVFHTISTAGIEAFCDKVEILPTSTTLQLYIRGKPLFNTPSIHSQLQSWITHRRTELGTCSLCFTSQRKSLLHPSCGRSGCAQRICTTCLKSWYGQNAIGQLINIAALHCPFCRRAPAPKTLGTYGMGIHTVPGLRTAVTERGTWIHGWCTDCASAARFIPRSCARGAPSHTTTFCCEPCTRSRERRAAEAAEALRRLRIQDAANRRANSLNVDTTPWERSEEFAPFESIKECPGCGVATVKTYGCNHMGCVCGCHWCYVCGEGFSGAGEVYEHMSVGHDGYF